MNSRFQKLERFFVIGDQDQVKRTLKACPPLIQLLHDIHQNIERYFPGSEIMLDATLDPEGLIGENEELVVSICTQLDSKEAIKTLEQFYDEWWSIVSVMAMGKISIGLEFEGSALTKS